jgi:sec-independent protein translocase protein TatB
MFDIGWSELLIVGVVALIVIGPKELPGVLRAIGHWMTKIRRMASEFQGQFQEAMREAEMADLKKEVDDMASQAQSYADFDPTESIRNQIEGAVTPPESGSQATPAPEMTDAAADELPPPGHDGNHDVAHVPDVETPKVDAPKADAPESDTPKSNTPKSDTPSPDASSPDASSPGAGRKSA